MQKRQIFYELGIRGAFSFADYKFGEEAHFCCIINLLLIHFLIYYHILMLLIDFIINYY